MWAQPACLGDGGPCTRQLYGAWSGRRGRGGVYRGVHRRGAAQEYLTLLPKATFRTPTPSFWRRRLRGTESARIKLTLPSALAYPLASMAGDPSRAELGGERFAHAVGGAPSVFADLVVTSAVQVQGLDIRIDPKLIIAVGGVSKNALRGKAGANMPSIAEAKYKLFNRAPYFSALLAASRSLSNPSPRLTRLPCGRSLPTCPRPQRPMASTSLRAPSQTWGWMPRSALACWRMNSFTTFSSSWTRLGTKDPFLLESGPGRVHQQRPNPCRVQTAQERGLAGYHHRSPEASRPILRPPHGNPATAAAQCLRYRRT